MGRHANRKKQIEEPADALSALANTVFALASLPKSGLKRGREVHDDSSISTASTDEKHDNDSEECHNADHSDSEEFCNEEVEAVSSLANIFHAAVKSRTTSLYSDCFGSTQSWPRTYERRKSRPRDGAAGSSSSRTDDAVDDNVCMKQQRRREKNRASAQQSRQRKKCHLETLEQRVEELEQERAELSERMRALRADNAALRAALAAATAAAAVLPRGEAEAALPHGAVPVMAAAS